MRTIAAKLVTSIFFGALASTALFAADYHYTRFDAPGAIFTAGFAINARGVVVGNYDAADGGHGFLLRKGVFTTIDFPSASYTNAIAINARGDIAGYFGAADGTEHGFMLRDGQFTQIDPPGASQTNARGINNAGDITGIFLDAGGNLRGFILRDGTLQRVQVPDSLTTDVRMAEDNGRVMVGETVLKSDGASHGFVRDASGHFDIIDVPGTNVPCTFVNRINESGDIVGYFANVDSIDACNNFPHIDGFLLHQGNYTTIKVPGAIDTALLGINDDGAIVGNFLDKKGVHGFKAVPVN